MKRLFAEHNAIRGTGGEGGHNLNGTQLVTAGVLAGLANGVVSGPVEHIRIRTLLLPVTCDHTQLTFNV